MQATHSRPRPVIFGELLYDQFEQGDRVLGGAPFNVGWHLRALGLDPLLVSAVGDDAAGRRIRESIVAWGMDPSGIQTVDAPTGLVQVSIEQGEPRFLIPPGQAWDRIDAAAAQAATLEQPVSLLCHGTLALREAQSRFALETLRDNFEVPTLLDANLRPPWYRPHTLRESLTQARWVKLNAAELAEACANEDLPPADLATQARNLRARHGLDMLLVTDGGNGALLLTTGEIAHQDASDRGKVVDTVGAGDAFTAVMIVGITEQWPPHLILRRAVDFSAAIVRQRGATSTDRDLYLHTLDRWQEQLASD